MTPWVARLIFTNVLVFFLQQASPRLTYEFALIPAFIIARPWTAVTYMFLHAGFMHIAFNMLSLFFFGPRLETRLGGRRFMALYLLSGFSGAVLSIATPLSPIVGASGAIYGVMIGFAWFWPREPIYLYGIIGIEARWMVLLMTGISLFGAASAGRDGIAHFAHLGGFVGGWLYLKWMERTSDAAKWQRKIQGPSLRPSGTADLVRWKGIDREALHPVNREEYDRVMAKIAFGGVGTLTPGDREFLDRFAPR